MVYCYLESNSLPFELADPDDVKSTDVQHDQDIHTFESTPWRQAEIRKKKTSQKKRHGWIHKPVVTFSWGTLLL